MHMNDKYNVFNDKRPQKTLVIKNRTLVTYHSKRRLHPSTLSGNYLMELNMLSLKHVSKTYSDGTQALNNINLNLPSGLVGLLGPNGAGKSTLMRTIACLQQVDSGQIRFNGIDIIKQPHQLRLTLGYLPQSFGVFPNMSCEGLLKYIATLKGLNKTQQTTQVSNLLEVTNLTHVAKRQVAKFSGGMKQRFGIAQALLGNPKLIIMDEPTAGLDPLEREALHKVLVDISHDKLILLSTHIVEDIENLCQHTAIINQGQVAENGSVQQLLQVMEGRVWMTSSLPENINKFEVLSHSYQFGKPAFRVFSHQKPTEDAILVSPCLQDKYMHSLNIAEH